jgi:hypothetical protein
MPSALTRSVCAGFPRMHCKTDTCAVFGRIGATGAASAVKRAERISVFTDG